MRNLTTVFLVLFVFVSQARAAGTYRLDLVFDTQGCFQPVLAPPPWHSYYLGPADSNGKCLKDGTKTCWPEEQFAAFSLPGSYRIGASGAAGNICDTLHRTSCELMTLSIAEDPSSKSDTLFLRRDSIKAGQVTSTESFFKRTADLGATESRFVLPNNGCSFIEVRYRISEIK